MNRMNEKWNYTLHEYYYVYGVLYSRLERMGYCLMEKNGDFI